MDLIMVCQAISSLLTFATGFFVLIKKPHDLASKIFFALSLLIGSWVGANLMIGYYTLIQVDPSFAYKIAISIASFHPPTLVLFSWIFPQSKATMDSKNITFKIFTIYAIGTLFGMLALTNLYIKNITIVNGLRYLDVGFMYYLFAFYFSIFTAYSFFKLLDSHKKSNSFQEKNQIKYILIGLIVSYVIGAGSNLFLPLFFNYLDMEGIGSTSPLFIVVFTAYAITKHHLMDIKVIVQKTAIYSLLVSIFTGIFLSLIVLGEAVFRGFLGYHSIWITVISIFIITLLFQTLRDKIQNSTHRIFFREKYMLAQSVKEIGLACSEKLGTEGLIRFATESLRGSLKAENVSVLLLDEESGSYKVGPKQSKRL